MFDSHAHYDDEQYDVDRDIVLTEMFASGISYVLNPGSDVASSQAAVQLSEKYASFYAAVGVHPHAASSWTEETASILQKLIALPKTVAIGEIGLDYHYDFSPREVQRTVFAAQIALARKLQMPLIVHDREAHQDMLQLLREEKAAEVGGVMHMYSGSVEMAKLLLDMNFYIGLGGPVTFKNAVKVLDVVRFVPEDRLLIETDSPYMAPVPYRGKRNRSEYLSAVLETMASLRGTTVKELEKKTTENALRLFRIPCENTFGGDS